MLWVHVVDHQYYRVGYMLWKTCCEVHVVDNTSAQLMCTHTICDPQHIHVVSTAHAHSIRCVCAVDMLWITTCLCCGTYAVENNVNVTHTIYTCDQHERYVFKCEDISSFTRGTKTSWSAKRTRHLREQAAGSQTRLNDQTLPYIIYCTVQTIDRIWI